jgi:hypothetical protein
MSGMPTFLQNLVASRASTAVADTFTAAQSILNPTDVINIPGNYLFPGAQFKMRLFGALKNVVTAVPTFTFSVKLGSIHVWSSQAISAVATANSLSTFEMDIDLRLDTEGNGTLAKFIGKGRIQCAVFGTAPILMPAVPAVGNGFDSTSAGNLDVQLAISASNAANGVRVDNYTLDQYRFGS